MVYMSIQFEPKARSSSHQARVWFADGYFMWVVAGPDGIIGRGGADREVGDFLRLVEATRHLLDWHAGTNIEIARRLRKLELDRYDSETQSVAERVAV